MVDPQAPGVGEVGPQHFDESAKAIAHQAFGGEGGNAPTLARAVENVRWRANGEGGEQFVLATPGLAATAIGTHGQVGNQANAHAAAAGGGLRALQAPGDQPLAEGEEADAPGILFGEFGQGGAARVAPLLRPFTPIEALPLGQACLLNGFEAAMIFQRFTPGMTKAAEVGVQRMFALHEAFVQRL
ncbi:hypothetical protein D3C76_799070 [compost metagenome]